MGGRISFRRGTPDPYAVSFQADADLRTRRLGMYSVYINCPEKIRASDFRTVVNTRDEQVGLACLAFWS